jgi:nitrous oxidase accessory protein NosD
VFVGDDSCTNVIISGNVFTSPQRGVRVLSGTAGALVIGVVIAANTVTRPKDGGILVSQSTGAEVTGIDIIDNSVHLAGSGTYGVRILGAGQCRITGNRVYRPTRQAIYLDTVDMVEVSDNLLRDAGYGTPNTYDAIYVTSSNPALASNRVTARNNTVYGSARYAVYLDRGTGMTVTGTRWRSLGPGGVQDLASGTVRSDNIQF